LSQGKRLGGQRIPLDEARRQARAAAEQRRVLATRCFDQYRMRSPELLRFAAAQRQPGACVYLSLGVSQGKRLGGQRIPLDEARRQARAAAEQRRVLAKNSRVPPSFLPEFLARTLRCSAAARA
jgi:hypothetical protein